MDEFENNNYTENNNTENNNTGNEESRGTYSNMPVAMQTPKSSPVNGNSNANQKKKKHGFGRFCGRVLLLILGGALFGACAAFVLYEGYFNMDRILGKTSEEIQDEFDTEAYKTLIEKDILAKLDEREDLEEGSVKTVVTENDVTMRVTDVSDIVEVVMPSVVSITNSYTYVTNYWGMEYSQPSEASGSGIIIGENDEELMIATNNHVIESAEELTVQFIDGETAEAKVKGADADNDVAVIAVKFEDLKASTIDSIDVATLGDSDSLKVGEPAIAIGNALGYGQSVTTGVISALDRKIEIDENKFSEGFIQTDAAINPGNSGGALLNDRGEVIGINSSKIGGTTVEGMGYAIPITRALPIIDDLKTKKTKTEVKEEKRGYLGISGRGISDEMADVYEFPKGVFVYEVYEGTGAEEAGLRKGDIIVKLDGSTIRGMEQLQGELAYYEAGETVEVIVKRMSAEGSYEDVTFEVELVPADMMPSE